MERQRQVKKCSMWKLQPIVDDAEVPSCGSEVMSLTEHTRWGKGSFGERDESWRIGAARDEGCSVGVLSLLGGPIPASTWMDPLKIICPPLWGRRCLPSPLEISATRPAHDGNFQDYSSSSFPSVPGEPHPPQMETPGKEGQGWDGLLPGTPEIPTSEAQGTRLEISFPCVLPWMYLL